MLVQVLNTVWREASGILGQIVTGVMRVIKTGMTERVDVNFTVLGRTIGLGIDIRLLASAGEGAPGTAPGTPGTPAPVG